MPCARPCPPNNFSVLSLSAGVRDLLLWKKMGSVEPFRWSRNLRESVSDLEIIDKLVKEGTLSKAGTNCYTIMKQKNLDYEFDTVKEEMDTQVVANGKNAQQDASEDHMYMKALYHALPMNYVTTAKLQNKLDGKINQATVRKLIDKMTREGFLDAKSNRRLGKRVIHSDLTEKKLKEVKKTLDIDSMLIILI